MNYKVTKIYEAPTGICCEMTSLESGEDFTLVLGISDVYEAHLSEGKMITDDAFEALYEASMVKSATVRAQRLLSLADHSKKQLVTKLRRYGIAEEYASKASLIMEEMGYIDECSQAERLAAAYCQNKHWGKRRIAAALFEKGYDRENIMRAVNLIPPEEYERALLCVMERKYSKAPADKKEKEKRTAALLRLGFSVSEIIKAEKTLY